MVLAYTFFKPYISKICNDFSLYIYRERERIYNLIELRLFNFLPNNSLAKKKKKKMDTWQKIGLQLKIQVRM